MSLVNSWAVSSFSSVGTGFVINSWLAAKPPNSAKLQYLHHSWQTTGVIELCLVIEQSYDTVYFILFLQKSSPFEKAVLASKQDKLLT